MTIVAHGAFSGMSLAALGHAVGLGDFLCGNLFSVGVALGASNDALPWAIGRLTDRGDLEQKLREQFHDPKLILAGPLKYFLFPYLHALCDSFIHAPQLPDPGTSPFFDQELIFGRTVRDLVWSLGELALWGVVCLLYLVYRA